MNGLRRTLVTATTTLLLASAGTSLADERMGAAPTRGPVATAASTGAPSPNGTPTTGSEADAPEVTPDRAAGESTLEERLNAEPLGGEGLEAPVTGEEPFDASAPEGDESLIWTLVRTFLLLGLVIAVIYVVLNFGLRRMMGLKPGASPATALVTVVERVPLDPKRSLLVLKAAGEYLLVGTGDAGITLIAKLQTDEVERLQRERSEAPGSMSPFLLKLLSRGGHPPPSA